MKPLFEANLKSGKVEHISLLWSFSFVNKWYSIVYRNHRIYGGSPPLLLCWLWWQSTIWKLSEMVDYHGIQVLIWWKVIIWCRSTIIFYVIARAIACQPVRVQTGECKDLIWIGWIYDGCAPYLLLYRFPDLVPVHIPFDDHFMFYRTTIMALVSPLFLASVASLTLAMTTIDATIKLLQQMKILPTSGTCTGIAYIVVLRKCNLI